MNSSNSTPPNALSSAPAQPAPELLTQVQLARRLGISRRTLATWVRNQTVPMIKVRGFCRFDFAKVRAVLEGCEQPATRSQVSAVSSSEQGLQAP